MLSCFDTFLIMAALAKKPSLILNLEANGLKVTFELPTMTGQAGCLQRQDRSLSPNQAAAKLDVA
ncbi:hypothetical protein J6590_061558 [Homalodisca vitripennis]|nr:hypothetical protein J6590_061558 [Homalodisca vitripennis]